MKTETSHNTPKDILVTGATPGCEEHPARLPYDEIDGLEMAKEVGGKGQVIGVDFCEEMLGQAQYKLAKTRYQNTKFILARAEVLPFPDDTFDSATIGFGLRNVADIGQVLREMIRVVKTGGNTSLEIRDFPIIM
jgi:ubiquinone/menaquinone biosynthesis C-methylase UbiE